MRSINFRYVTVVTVSLGLLLAGIFIVHGVQVKRNAGTMLKLAHKAKLDGNLEAAADYLNRYRGLAPEDTDALADYGLILEELANGKKAKRRVFLIFEEVLRRDAARVDIRRRQVGIALAIGRVADALGHLTLLRESSSNDATLEYQTGLCHQRMGDDRKAADAYTAAIRIEPGQIDAHTRLADLLRDRLDQPDAADKLLDEMIDQNPNSTAAFLVRARYQKRQGRIADALADARHALALDAKDTNAIRDFGELAIEFAGETLTADQKQISARAAAEARRYLKRAVQSDPDSVNLARILSRLEWVSGDRDEAVSRVEQLFAENPHESRVFSTLAHMLIVQDEFAAARGLLSRFSQDSPASSAIVGYFEGRLLMAEEKWPLARTAMEEARENPDNSSSLIVRINDSLAQCYHALGNRTEELDAYQRILRISPSSIKARLGLAAVSLQSGRVDDAVYEYRQLLNVAEVPAKLARLLILQNRRLPEIARNWNEIEDLLKRAKSFSDDPIETALLRIEYLAARDRWKEAGRLVQQTLSADPNRVELHVLQPGSITLDDPRILREFIGFYLQRNRFQRAETLLRKLIAQHENISDEQLAWARRSLAVVLATIGKSDGFREATQLLDENKRRNADSVEDRRAEAAILAGQEQVEPRRKAVGILEEMDSRGQLTGSDRLLLARLYVADGKWDVAERQFQKVFTGDDANPTALAAYIRGLIQQKQFGKAVRWLKQLQTLQPNAFHTVQLSAQLEVVQGSPERAIGLLQDYLNNSQAQPTDSASRLGLTAALVDRLSQLLSATGRKSESKRFDEIAEELYRRYVKEHPNELLVLVSFLSRRGRVDDALTLCEQGWTSLRAELVAEVSLAALYSANLSDHQIQRIDGRITQAVRENPKSVPLRTSLADLRGLQGRFQEAEQLYRDILKDDADHVVSLNNLAWLLALQQRSPAEARNLIERAIKIEGPLPYLLDTRACVSLTRGRPQEAIADLQQVIATKPSAVSRMHLARAFLLSGDRAAARAALQDAVKAGLSKQTLHPLERPVYTSLQKDAAL